MLQDRETVSVSAWLNKHLKSLKAFKNRLILQMFAQMSEFDPLPVRRQELNRMRSRSVSRRSAPSSSAVEGSLSRMRSRSAHREQDRHSWVSQAAARAPTRLLQVHLSLSLTLTARCVSWNAEQSVTNVTPPIPTSRSRTKRLLRPEIQAPDRQTVNEA